MIILGLGGLQSGGACAVLKDGTIVAAIEESKLSRTPRPGVPEAARLFPAAPAVEVRAVAEAAAAVD